MKSPTLCLLFVSVILITHSAFGVTNVITNIVTTAKGNGADTWTSESSPDTNYGADHLNARWAPSKPRNDNIVLRFDLSGISGTITDVTLTMIKYRDYEQGDLTVYGVKNGEAGDALSDWTEAGLTYNNAPWITQDGSYDDNDFNGSMTAAFGTLDTEGNKGDTKSFSDPDLLSYLMSDSNGLVTLVLTRESLDKDHQERFASKEDSALDEGSPSGSAGDYAPSLVIRYIKIEGTLILIR